MPERTKTDLDALREQLVVGCDAGSDIESPGLRKNMTRNTGSSKPIFRTIGSCVGYQLDKLQARFAEIREAAGEAGVSIGLSGGFDSRLLFLLAVASGIPISPFSFHSRYHSAEIQIAKQIASHAGLKLRIIKVKHWTELKNSELDENINDSINLYNGRTNETMGTFSDVHTAKIMRECRGDAAINLNGLGGELYRNRERLPPYPFGFHDWFWQYVAKPDMLRAFNGKRTRKRFEDRMAVKYGKLLGRSRFNWIDRWTARQWYRDVWLRWFAGARFVAENKVGKSEMPFADTEVSEAALAATPFIGAHGEFEAAMIKRLDSKIAALPSTYGHNFARIPYHRKLRDQFVSLVPLILRIQRSKARKFWFRRNKGGIPQRFRERFKESVNYLKCLVPEVNINYLINCSKVSRDRALYIAEYQYRNRERVTAPKE